MIYLIAGKARSGKDTFANILKEQLEEKGQKVIIVHYGDYLKFICTEYFGWDGVKDKKGREVLQVVGTDTVRKRDENFWVSIVSMFISMFEEDYDAFIIPDCRFPNEIDEMRYWFDTRAIWIEREDYESDLTEEQKSHISETALDNYSSFDFWVSCPSGIENIRKDVTRFVTGILEKGENVG